VLVFLYLLLGLCVPLLLFFGVTFTLITLIGPAVRQLPTWLFIHRTFVLIGGWALLTAGSIALGLAAMSWMMRFGKKLYLKAERRFAL
jgi:hypothetical protein